MALVLCRHCSRGQ